MRKLYNPGLAVLSRGRPPPLYRSHQARWWSLMWNRLTARLHLHLPVANLCSTWELFCRTQLQKPLQAHWHVAADERTPDIGKGGWHVHVSPCRSPVISARMFRPVSSAARPGHAEYLL